MNKISSTVMRNTMLFGSCQHEKKPSNGYSCKRNNLKSCHPFIILWATSNVPVLCTVNILVYRRPNFSYTYSLNYLYRKTLLYKRDMNNKQTINTHLSVTTNI